MTMYLLRELHRAKTFMSIGLEANKTCKYCGIDKKGKSHFDCSRKMQKIRHEGEARIEGMRREGLL